jgi:hypothetical protein
MYKKFLDENKIMNLVMILGGSGNDPDSDNEKASSEDDGPVESKVSSDGSTDRSTDRMPVLPKSEQRFIVSNVDSKTKGHERFADCFVREFGTCNSIRLGIFNKNIYRI